MKKVILSAAAVMLASFSFAQESAVKEAKRLMSSDPYQAETVIKGALTNPETSSVANTWNIAGKIEEKIHLKENENMYLRQTADTLKMYLSLVDMCDYFIKCDQLEQIPDAKGKVKLKSRRANSAMIDSYRPTLLNGGGIMYNAGNDAAALKLWGKFVDLAFEPMMEKFKYQEDTLLTEIAYYATVAAVRTENHDATIKYAAIAESNPEYAEFVAEYASMAYKAKGDTATWISYLKKCIDKYPTNQAFFGSLIDYYLVNNRMEDARRYGDAMLKNNPDNSVVLYVVGYINWLLKDYDKAIELLNKSISLEPANVQSYSALGGVYLEMAQDASMKIPVDVSDPNYAAATEKYNTYVAEARKCYEKVRELAPDKQDLWLRQLHNIYYVLNAPEFDEIERIMNGN